MTQPSPQDGLPDDPQHPIITGPLGGKLTRIANELFSENRFHAAEVCRLAGLAMGELDHLRSEMDYNVSIRERLKLLEDSNRDLRAEKAELIEMLATRTTHPEYVELLRRYRPANETEGK